MRIKQRNGLLFVTLTITYDGVTQTISDLVLDTGAVQSIINLSAPGMDALDIGAEDQDEFVFLSGIGGSEPALRKCMDRIQFDTFTIENTLMDFAHFDLHKDINGLLGLDILIPGRFVIDLDEMALHQRL